jgi:hypothetical protein
MVTEGVVSRLDAGGSHPQVGFTTAAGQRISYAQGGEIPVFFVSGAHAVAGAGYLGMLYTSAIGR